MRTLLPLPRVTAAVGAIVAGIAMIWGFCLCNYSLPVVTVVLIYLNVCGCVFLGLRLSGLPIGMSLLLCTATALCAVVGLRLATDRIIVPNLFIETTSWKKLDLALWNSTRGQILLTQVGAAEFDGPRLVSSNGREIRSLNELDAVFASAFNVHMPMAYRVGTCDLAFRSTSVVITAPEDARRLP